MHVKLSVCVPYDDIIYARQTLASAPEVAQSASIAKRTADSVLLIRLERLDVSKHTFAFIHSLIFIYFKTLLGSRLKISSGPLTTMLVPGPRS